MSLKKLSKNKKGVFGIGDMQTIALVIMVTGIVIGIGVYVLATMGSTLSSTSAAASTIVNNTATAVGDFADWLPIIVVISAAAIILGIIGMAFSFGRGR
jgi:hypothetical protein